MVNIATPYVSFKKTNIQNISTNSRANLLANMLCGIVLLTAIFSLKAESIPGTFSQCVACHGEQAQGNERLNSPSLAGQSASYLTRQLANFSTGVRGSHQKDILGKQMLAISKQLNKNTDVPALAAYLSKLPSAKLSQNTSGDMKNGSRYYQAKCGACHGGNAQGNPAFKAPKLSGQNVDYLSRQMQNFVNSIRGTHADDKLGRQMAMMAKITSGKELDDIFHYIASQE